MSSDKIWAYSNTGNLAHAFVQNWTDKDGNESSEHLRAMCRKTITRHAFTRYEERKNMFLGLCANCVKLADAMHDRYDASLEPATEAHDLGYVPTGDADSLDNEQRERLQAGFDAAVSARHASPAAETVTIQGQPVETLADAESMLVRELRAEVQDAAHAEALEMDAAGEALTAAHADAMTLLERGTEPVRWHYLAHRQTSQGAFLGVISGYVTYPAEVDAPEAEERIRADFRGRPGTRIANFNLRKA